MYSTQNNLPGSSIQVIDEYNKTTYDTTQFNTTESILIIGTAFDGPSEKEVAIYHPDQAAYIFGESYDYRTKRSSSLVAAIEEVYDAGCRTIYAMRLGGKELSKNYRLREDIPAYLKVSSIFPSNRYKDMAFLYKDGKMTFYKTNVKATIDEKRQGVLDSSEGIIKFEIDLGGTYEISKSSRLIELVRFVNSYPKNNVFKLSIVDSNGIDITQTDLGQTILVDSLFEGIYTVGRKNPNNLVPRTVLVTKPASSAFASSLAVLSLTENNDFSTPFPYIVSNISEKYKFLEVLNGLDTISSRDNVDYEEVDLSSFEVYKRLGSGYAQTAMLVERGEGVNKKFFIKPTPSTDPNYTVEVSEGIYSIAANLKTDIRIMAAGYADTKISANLPTVEEFTKSSYQKIPVALCKEDALTPAYYATYRIEEDETKAYQFITQISSTAIPFPSLTTTEIQAALTGKVYNYSELSAIPADAYGIVDFEKTLWIAKATGIIMPLSQVNKNNEVVLSVAIDTGSIIQYTFTIKEGLEDWFTMDDFADFIQTTSLEQLFNFEFNHNIPNVMNAFIVAGTCAATENKQLSHDLNLFIPYTTSDNFLRQLAQHVEYTSLKTHQTHGGLDVSPIVDTSIRAVSNKFQSLVEKNYDLVVKNGKGKTSLDNKNNPYGIGKNVTVSTIQHAVATNDGYNYVSGGIATYFAIASRLSSDVSTTNRKLPIFPHFEYSESQKVVLNKKGYVTTTYKDNRYHITDGVTQAPNYSQFSRYATIRTIKLVNAAIRQATEPYIGKKNNLTNRNSLHTAIKSNLDKLLDTHLEKYEFQLVYDQTQSNLGTITADYTIDITDEIRNVHNRVTCKNEI